MKSPWFFFRTNWKGELRTVGVMRDLVEDALGTDATDEDMAAWIDKNARSLGGFLRFKREDELSPEPQSVVAWLDSKDIGW